MSIVSSTKRVIYSGLDVTATGYGYTNTASKADTDGWHTSKCTDCVVQIGLATMAKPVRYRIEGRATNADRAASINVGSISGNNIDKLIAVDTLKTPEIRIGVGVATEIASPNDAGTHNIYCQLILTDKR